MSTFERRALLALVAFAFCARLAVALLWRPPLEADAADYVRLASGLSSGAGYVDELERPTAWRPPGYPVFLALVEEIAGPGRAPVALAQAAVGAGTVALTWVVAQGLGPAAALVAAALVAVDAGQIALAARTLSEGLFTLLSLAVVALSLGIVRALHRGERAGGWAVGAGVLAGAATLTRGLFVAYPVVLAGGIVVLGRRRGALRPALAAATLLLVAYAAALLPWTLRNVGAVGAPLPVATQGGFTLYAGWFPPGDTGFGMLPDDAITAGAVGLSEVEQSAYFTERTLAGLRAEPACIPRMIALKLVYFWVPVDWELLPWVGVVNPTYLFVLLWAVALMSAGVRGGGNGRDAGDLPRGRGGSPRSRLRLAELWPLWLPVAYTLLMGLAFYTSPRTRAPIEPLLAVAAAAGLVKWLRTHGRRTAAIAIGDSAAAVALLAEPLKAAALAALRAAGIWRS